MRTTALILFSSVALAAPALPGPVDYLREVKPVFAERCYRCHGASQQKGGLRLDTAALALKGGEHGPAMTPGKGAASLVVQVMKGAHSEIARMPYKKPPLAVAQIALIEEWIDKGAKAQADEQPEISKHWSFIPPERPALPSLKKRDWARNPVDRFILERLESENIEPSAEADRATLIRRLSLDLLGLPPAPAELDEFVNDPRPDAYERLVERLLASPHYGERWGRWWLDVARYADSNGYSIDAPRQIWKYRDWVINALNRDLPFDQFVIDQLAGDLLPHATFEQKIATGFHRNTQINQEGGIDPEQFRVESVIDRVNTTGTVFLGLTIGCAQCHDHKFDPITQKEYYRLFAFFNSTADDGHGKAAPGGLLEVPGEFEKTENLQKETEEAEADLERYLDTKGSDVVKWEQALADDEREKLSPNLRETIKLAWDRRNIAQKRAVYAAFKADDPEFKSRNSKLARLEKREPRPITTLVMSELDKPRESHVFVKGDFTRKGELVTPGVPAILHPLVAADPTQRVEESDDGIAGATEREPPLFNRLDLARWIVDPNNPLTARVTVNRVWEQYFGKGLVETENDFGTQGTPPTHPELLDWLACEFMTPSASGDSLNRPKSNSGAASTLQRFNASTIQRDHAWSLKHIHRLIVTSATYRQSSRARPDLREKDPTNKLLARQNRLRLDAEIVRDVCLSASGLLNHKIGGPSVFPPQPEGVMTLGQVRRAWKANADDDRYRRGIYTFLWRATPHPALAVFDAPDAFSACTRRMRSNTPLQALTLLNDDAFVEFSQALAERVVSEAPKTDAARLELAFRLCLSRSPAPGESQRLLALLSRERAALEKSPQEAAALLSRKPDASTDVKQLAAWTTVSRVLLNLDETITRE